MWQGDERLDIEPVPEGRVPASGDANTAVGRNLANVEPLRQLGEDAEREVDLTVIEHLHGIGNAEQLQVDFHARCLPSQHFDEPGDHREVGIVGAPDREAPLRHRRIERALDFECFADLLQRLADRTRQRQGVLGGPHLLRRADEQLIVEHDAELRERAAHAGLHHADTVGGAADAAFDQQRLEGKQQIQVDRGQVFHGIETITRCGFFRCERVERTNSFGIQNTHGQRRNGFGWMAPSTCLD